MAERKPKTAPAAEAEAPTPNPAAEAEPVANQDTNAGQSAQAETATKPAAVEDVPAPEAKVEQVVNRDPAAIEQEPAPAEDDAAAPEPDTPSVRINAIEVVAKCESFRRAGRVFTRTPVKILLDTLSEAEFKLLTGEPMLAVQFTHLAEED